MIRALLGVAAALLTVAMVVALAPLPGVLPTYEQAFRQCRSTHSYDQCIDIVHDEVDRGAVLAPRIR